MHDFNLSGTYTALITPFHDTLDIDWVSFEKLVKHQVESGLTGLVPCGTTGESPTLTHEEHSNIIKKVTQWAKASNPDVQIMAGTGSNSTKEAIELTKRAIDNGVDLSLQVNPYYNKPTQQGLIEHFSTIADQSTIPIVLYNIPGRTSVQLSIETIITLAQHPNIVGIKEATSDINFMTNIISKTKPYSFQLLSGDDTLLLPMLSIGGKGIISVCSNIAPKTIQKIIQFYKNNQTELAQELFYKIYAFCNALFVETNPIPIKYIASKLNICNNTLRLPLLPLNSTFHSKINKEFEIIKDLA